jgi:putative nucleotidyltransferase with HDIG domain
MGDLTKKAKANKKKSSQVLAFRREETAVLPAPVQPALFADEVYPEVLIESLRAITSSLEEKDSYTHGHSIRVAQYSVMLAQELGLSEVEVREVELCAVLHDVGKIGIPDAVLLKPARLTRAEFEIMKSHPVRSARICEKISSLHKLIPGIKHHHERFDGLGYPDGLKGYDIPLYSRIILVVDTFDAMTSTRPYRLALDKEIAYSELEKCSGTQFDPALVEAFLKAMRRMDAGEERAERVSLLKKIA